MKKISILITILIIIACKNSSNTGGNDNKMLIEQKDSLIVGTFSKIPAEIDGCSCYFFLSEKDKKNEQYVCVNDFGNLAFISLNGKLEKFEMTFSDNTKKEGIYSYSNKKNNLQIVITERAKSGEESSRVKATLTLYSGSKELIQKKIIGECGC